MSDETPGVPAVEPEPVAAEPTAEELEAVRIAAEAESDRAVEAELRRVTRRSFLFAGVASVAGVAAWGLLRSRPGDGQIAWPFRRTLEANETLAEAYFSPQRLNPTFPASRITRPARINGGLGLSPHVDAASWRLNIEGLTSLTLDDIRAFPRQTMVTELRCIEGWNIIAEWSGARLADVLAKFPPARPARYLGLETPDRGYYVGLDLKSAQHPQTLLAYELNGAPLSWQHGAPVRLAIPVKYGIKNIKHIGTIRYTDVRPADYWAERGYDWYAGF